MRQGKPGTNIRLLWLGAILIMHASCLIGGCVRQSLPVIVLPDSEQVFLIEPNEPFTAPWPAAVLSRGRYLELVDAEMELLSRGDK